MSRPFPVPRVLIVHITDRCNLSCRFCDLPKGPRDFSFKNLSSLLKEGSDLGIPNLVLTGGEPLLHPEIESILSMSSSLGFGLNITTNGTPLVDLAGMLAGFKVASVSVSIDGKEETHDDLRGVKGAYKRTMAGIEALKSKAPKTRLSIYMVVTEVNAAELNDVYDLSGRIGADFNFWPVNNQPGLYMRSDTARQAYISFVQRLAQENREFEKRKDYYLTGLEYHRGKRLRVRCMGLSDQAGISVTGELLPCCVWGEKSLIIGNAVEQGLPALLSCSKAEALRKKIYSRGCVGLCYNHSLYEFSQKTGEPFLLGVEY
ncbi:MAG: radical SAM protein [Deltaproteobacteria bacterium]|nr:radical SAM protein [Deltaproteobacteria bacterium]